MADLSWTQIMDAQRELLDRHRSEWTPLTPENGRSALLWMTEEFGEIVSVVKKRGERAIMQDAAVREAFVEEFADLLMFMSKALQCYGVSADELSEAFFKKHRRNLSRDWKKEEAGYLKEE